MAYKSLSQAKCLILKTPPYAKNTLATSPEKNSKTISTQIIFQKYTESPPNESTDPNILNRDQSQEDFLSHLFADEKEPTSDEKNESGKK